MKAGYKSWEKAAQKLVRKLVKSCAEAGIKAGEKLDSFCAAFSQFLTSFFHEKNLGRSLYKSWGKAGQKLVYESWV